MKAKKIAILFAILAATLYAVNIPISKILLEKVNPTMLASFLYLGAGIGLFIYKLIKSIFSKKIIKEKWSRKEYPYLILMVILDIIAPILLMFGISKTNSANVSLLNNFEIVATSIIAFLIFKETVSKRIMLSILLVTVASIILSFEGNNAFVFNAGSLLVLGACICWGFENNCTKMISDKDSIEIVTIKGIFSGLGSFIIALIIGESIPNFVYIAVILLLGFVSYGLSINFYIKAQKDLGASKTSAYYAINPFLGVIFSFILLKEIPSFQFFIALGIMIISTIVMVKDTLKYS